MSTLLKISLWEKFARYWQPSDLTVEGRGRALFVDAGGEKINPIMDEDFDLDDELDAFFGRD